MKTIDVEAMRGVKNESGLTPDQVVERLAPDKSVEVTYGKVTLRIERHVLEDARARVATMSPDERLWMMNRVERALRRNIGRIGPRLSKKKNDDTAVDLVVWHALKEHAS